MSSGFEQRATAREEPMDKTKSYEISKQDGPDSNQNYSCTGKWGFFQALDDGSRMSREVHVRFCEGLGVKVPRATHLN
jgi:hypothetical protein